MRKKLTAWITLIVLIAAMMPVGVFADSGKLELEDIRLAKTIATDQDGNVVYAGYYNQKEELVYAVDYSSDDPNEFSDTYYTYNAEGDLIEETTAWYDGSTFRNVYQYNEDHLMTEISSYTQNDYPETVETFTYNSSGDPVLIRFESVEGEVYTTEITYDDNGREILRTETEKENVEAKPTTWVTKKSYHEISELAWDVTITVYDEKDQVLSSYTESVEYNDRGNLLSSVDYIEGELYRTVNTYDSEDRLTYSEQTMVDDAGYPASIYTYQYRPDDRIDRETYQFEGYQYNNQYYYSLQQFDDVYDTEYFAYPVKWAVDRGITSGISATEFGPYENCTRGQAVTFLWRAAGQPEPSASVNPFLDVSESDYYYKAVLWAVENGITNGISEKLFGPDQSCNRGQIVTFLYRSKGEPGLGGTVAFTDVTEGDYYYGAVLWAVADGVTNGTTETTFSPEQNCTRGQIVTFLYRSMAE